MSDPSPQRTPGRVLITGGAGFIGANLTRLLLGAGRSVTVLDNFYTGRRVNLDGLAGDLTILEGDVTEPFDVPGVTEIYHLACPASPPHYQRDPIFTARTCFEGTLRVLELARRTGARVVHASTSEIYGDPSEHPQRETYRGNVSCTGPRACYDEGKRVAETLCFDMARRHGVDVGVVRIFNTYGPFMDPQDGRVVSNFIVSCLSGEPLTLYGDGQQTRSFCHVSDLVRGLGAMMAERGFTGPVNLGNPVEITVAELAERVLALTASPQPVVRAPLPVDDPTRRRPDISLARERLGWSPQVDLKSGLVDTVEYFKKALNTSVGA